MISRLLLKKRDKATQAVKIGACCWTAIPLGDTASLCRWFSIGLLFLTLSFGISGTPSPVLPADKLDRSIDEVIQKPEYTWRFPRDKTGYNLSRPDLDLSFLERIGRSIERAFKKVGVWIKDLVGWLKFNPNPRQANGTAGLDWGNLMRLAIYLLILALMGLIGYLLFKLWKQRAPRGTLGVESNATEPAPNLTDESVGADQMPENEWMLMARDLLQQGEFRLALRAYYLASLAHLSERNLITIARFKSNRDYERELNRRSHALPGLADRFSRNVALFERVWYGMHDISQDSVRQFATSLEELKGGAEPA